MASGGRAQVKGHGESLVWILSVRWQWVFSRGGTFSSSALRIGVNVCKELRAVRDSVLSFLSLPLPLPTFGFVSRLPCIGLQGLAGEGSTHWGREAYQLPFLLANLQLSGRSCPEAGSRSFSAVRNPRPHGGVPEGTADPGLCPHLSICPVGTPITLVLWVQPMPSAMD